MKITRELKDHEITTALVAGHHAAMQVGKSPSAQHPPDVELAVDTAERIVQEILDRTARSEKPVTYRYECRHGHITTADFDQGVVPDAEIDCDDESKGNNYTPCQKSAWLLGTVDEYRPEPLPPGVLHIDEFSSQAQDGGDKRMGIHIEWLRGAKLGPDGNTLTPDEISELFGAVVSAVEQWVGDRSDLQVLYDRD